MRIHCMVWWVYLFGGTNDGRESETAHCQIYHTQTTGAPQATATGQARQAGGGPALLGLPQLRDLVRARLSEAEIAAFAMTEQASGRVFVYLCHHIGWPWPDHHNKGYIHTHIYKRFDSLSHAHTKIPNTTQERLRQRYPTNLANEGHGWVASPLSPCPPVPWLSSLSLSSSTSHRDGEREGKGKGKGKKGWEAKGFDTGDWCSSGSDGSDDSESDDSEEEAEGVEEEEVARPVVGEGPSRLWGLDCEMCVTEDGLELTRCVLLVCIHVCLCVCISGWCMSTWDLMYMYMYVWTRSD